MQAEIAVIEATGKRASFTRALRACMAADIRVMATQGTLVDLPRGGAVAARNGDYAVSDWQPHSPVYADVTAALSSAAHVHLWTDNDDEGEWIAAQCAFLSPQARHTRYRTAGLDVEQVRAALERPGAVDMHVVQHAVARRIFNQIVGFGAGWHCGPVTAPLLASVDDAPLQAGPLCFSVSCEAGQTWEMRVPILGFEDAAAACREVRAMAAPRVTEGAAAERPAPRSPDGPAMTADLAAAAGMPVTKMARRFQEEYMGGRLSYPRTRAGHLQRTDRQKLYQLLLEQGVMPPDGMDSGADMHEESGHSALIPLSLESEIAAAVLGRWLDNGARRVVEGTPGGAARWTEIWSRNVTFERPDGMPRIPPCARSWRGMREVPADIEGPRMLLEGAVFERLRDLGLGTPATLPGHTARTCSRHIAPDGTLSVPGRAALAAAHDSAPQMLEIEHARAAQDALARQGTLAERISRALEAIGHPAHGLLPADSPVSRLHASLGEA